MSMLARELTRYVPVEVLQSIAKKYEITYAGKTKDEIAESVVSATQHKELLEKLRDNYRYAGRTAVSWFSVTDLPTKTVTQKWIVGSINGYTNRNPFKDDLKPTPSSEPKITKAAVMRKNSILVEFVYADKILRYEQDYKEMEVRPSIYVPAFYRLGSLTLEIRTNVAKASIISKIMLQMLGGGSAHRVTLTDTELDRVKKQIKGRLKLARHKENVGDYDTHEVNAAPQVIDLAKSHQYIKDFTGKETRRKRFYFDFKTPQGTQEICLEINPKTGSFWFRSEVSEEVVDYVFEAVRKVKKI